MAAKKVGALIKEARTAAGLTQEQLARKIKGVSAEDISKAERSEKEFTQAVLKEIAKATGVTQKSLLDAAKGTTAKTSAKTSSSTAKKKTTTSTAKKKTTSSAEIKLSTEEKKLVKAYRSADEKIQLAVKTLLLGPSSISGASAQNALGSIVESVQGLFGGK